MSAGSTLLEVRPTNSSHTPAALSQKSLSVAKSWIASGIFFLVLSTYIVSGPGRIDITDGQQRYEVAYNWLVEGRPVFRNQWLKQQSVSGRDGQPYSLCGAPASVFSMPLVWWGAHLDDFSREASRFLFSLTSSFFGAGVAVILFLFYLELRLSVQQALGWTLVNAFGTLLWPSSCSTFENAQRAFFAITAVFLGYLSSKRDSKMLAVAGGLTASVLLLYQEYHLLILPALALCAISRRNREASGESVPRSSSWSWLVSTIRKFLQSQCYFVRLALRQPGEERASCIRFGLWLCTAILVGMSLSFSYNHLRFGSSVRSGRMERTSPLEYMGSPISGFATLLLSPGKSIFLYSPPLVLGLLGMRRLRRSHPEIAFAVTSASIMLVAMLSYFAGASGDWCWGPRYLVVLLPLWSLALPFVRIDSRFKRSVVILILALGVLVQILALSVENQRFFFAKGLDDHLYWDSWVYFKHSALFSRVGEAISLKDPLPVSAKFFTSVPIRTWSTHCILGPPGWMPRSESPEWMKNFKIYYLPRPWPLWMGTINPILRPVNIAAWLKGLSAMFVAGLAFIFIGLQSATGGLRGMLIGRKTSSEDFGELLIP